ncbi:MAG: hypothetical protein A3C47_06355 [Omnitrophica bacterium RIFCSPHIGHO2_02_FULL_51_18]|nr:MAG: hypothetical protein A3C47_06355 [Omnitrophica bacterium RIFCSPHIGHO2_02_FULL_51_18]
MDPRACRYCNSSFLPNKYAPRQTVCSNLECQKKRQLESMRQWREKNPSYFKYDESKGIQWLEIQRRRSREWRQRNPDKVRAYRQTHEDEYRRYMREYMQRYRQKQKTQPPASGETGTDVKTPD